MFIGHGWTPLLTKSLLNSGLNPGHRITLGMSMPPLPPLLVMDVVVLPLKNLSTLPQTCRTNKDERTTKATYCKTLKLDGLFNVTIVLSQCVEVTIPV